MRAARAAGRGTSGRGGDPHEALTVTTFWLAGPIKPAAAWRLVATLKAAGPTFAPAAFRTDGALAARKLGRRAEALVVERLSLGAEVELLRRAGHSPRMLLHSGEANAVSLMTLNGPALTSLPDVMAFVELIKQLYDVLHPVAGVVNVVRAVEAESLAFPGWLTVFGPERVEEIGAARLLMAPVFLIEMLPDGGLLVANAPLPHEDGRGAGSRSTALADHLLGEGVLAGAPFRISGGHTRSMMGPGTARPARVGEP